jgi:hypothetical protein
LKQNSKKKKQALLQNSLRTLVLTKPNPNSKQ